MPSGIERRKIAAGNRPEEDGIDDEASLKESPAALSRPATGWLVVKVRDICSRRDQRARRRRGRGRPPSDAATGAAPLAPNSVDSRDNRRTVLS